MRENEKILSLRSFCFESDRIKNYNFNVILVGSLFRKNDFGIKCEKKDEFEFLVYISW